jgi:hypothetical protein
MDRLIAVALLARPIWRFAKTDTRRACYLIGDWANSVFFGRPRMHPYITARPPTPQLQWYRVYSWLVISPLALHSMHSSDGPHTSY